MMRDFIFTRRAALTMMAGLAAALGATAASATNEQYQNYARSCSPYIVGGCTEETSTTGGGLNIGGGYAFANGYSGGFALASAVFNPGAPSLLEPGVYEQDSIGFMTYSFQVQGAPNTLVPLHMIGAVSVSAIHLSDGTGSPAVLVDGVADPAPSMDFKIVGTAQLIVSSTRLTPYPQSGAGASVEAIYDPEAAEYCSGCGGGGASFDSIVWVYSNSDINVTLNTSTLLRYTAQGFGGGQPIYATVSGETDPVFSIDDTAYADFKIVGVPTGSPPPGIPGGGAGSVPEPASWAMMLGGFGLVGGAMRRRRGRATAVAI